MIYKDQYRIFKEKLEKEKANDSLLRLSNADQLTGLNNCCRIDNVLGHAIGEEGSRSSPLSIILFNIDFFKKVNDQ